VSAAAALHKEFRALLPTFLATIATVVLAAQTSPYFRVRLLLMAVCVGSVALGALSIGHEYAGRTLTLLLAQPVSRARLFATKAAVLLPLVLAVAAAGYFALPGDSQGQVFVNRGSELRAVLVLAPLCAIFLAPPLSMLCRSALAGIVFTLAIAGLFLLAGDVIGTAIHGFRNPGAVEAFKVALVWRGLSVACAAGAVAAWVTFTRLQAIEGHSEVALPAWLRRASPDVSSARRVPNVWAALVRKELHLQQLTFVVVPLYLLASGALWALRIYAPEFPRIPTDALSMLYGGSLVVLIGAVASAEERQLGTLATQLLLPMAAWQQWAVKVATALTLALVLGIALPLVVNLLAADQSESTRFVPRYAHRFMPALLLLGGFALYVSSLCSSGIRAAIVSMPVIVSAAVYAMAASDLFMRTANSAYRFTRADMIRLGADGAASFRQMESAREAGLLAGVLLLVAALVTLAFSNHRHIDRSGRWIAAQGAIVLALITLTAAFPAVLWAVWMRLVVRAGA
jgi:hypothetical protein